MRIGPAVSSRRPLMPGRLDILLLGGCHRDIVARTAAPFVPGTSCPGAVAETAGGVARNVAVLLASAGLSTALVARVGDDAAGRRLVAELSARGVDAALVAVEQGSATGTYVAIHDEAGELAAAVSDLSVYDRIDPRSLRPASAALAAAGIVFADANLPAATLDWLAADYGPKLAVDAISRAKAPRILGALRAGALGFLNLPSAATLTGTDAEDATTAARGLAALGATRLVVTGGGGGVAVLDEGSIGAVAVPRVAVVDVTGAGDALTAGTLAALSVGAPLIDAVRIGVAAAGAALSSTGALDRLPSAVLEALGTISACGAEP